MLAVVTYQFWATGENSDGILGLGLDPGVKSSINTFTESTNQALSGLAAISVKFHALAIGNDCFLYGWGLNDNSQLTDEIQGNPFSPTEITWFRTSGKPPKRISVGSSFSIVQTGNTELYAFGINDNGQLGINSADTEATQPISVDLSNLASNEKIIDIQSYGKLSYLLTSEGNLYFWGLCQDYLCPKIANDTKILMPTKANIDHNVSKFFLFYSNFWYQSQEGDIYVMGQNINGKLCLGQDLSNQYASIPQHLPSLKNVKKISSPDFHVIILLQNNSIYMCGQNNLGQFGIAAPANSVEPEEIKFDFGEVYDIAATTDGSIILSSKGLFATGNNIKGELTNSFATFTKIDEVTMNLSTYKIYSHLAKTFLYNEQKTQCGIEDNEDQQPDDTVNPSSLSPGAIAGICIAVIVVVVAIVVGSTLGVLAKKKMLLARGASAAAYAPHSGVYATRVV